MSKVICDREDMVAIADAVRNKTGNSNEMTIGEIVSGINNISGGSGGASVETCTVTINVPANVCVFGWGDCNWVVTGTTMGGAVTMPSTAAAEHCKVYNTTYTFNNIPISSFFTFYSSKGITGASTSENIDFSLANHETISKTTYCFAMCKCNGDGEITIMV